MIDFLLSPANTPFVISLGLMVTFTVIEILSVCLGMGLSEMVDSMIPEFDVDVDIDMDVDADIDANIVDISGPQDSLVKLLSWFRVGEVPVVMLFIIFLTGFGLSGIIVQYVMISLVKITLPLWIAVIASILAAIPTVRFCGGFLGKYMPKDETYAVSEESFPGMIATVTMGVAKEGKPAQAKLTDKHGQTHYILIEPDKNDESFSKGDRALIVSQQGALFKVIAPTSGAMTD